MIRNYQIDKSPSISGLYTQRTINMESKIWEYLRRFKSISYVQDLLSATIPIGTQNHHLIQRKAEDISYAIVQAEEYFNTAKSLSTRTKPLILYYGMVSLAKCLIMLGDNEYTLEASAINRAHGAHGLTTATDNRIPNTVSARNSDSLVNEFVRVKTSLRRSIYLGMNYCLIIRKINYKHV